jgi:3-oxoadipate enol-lactonase
MLKSAEPPRRLRGTHRRIKINGSRSRASAREETFMPEINADGCRIHVEVEGPERAPVLMLSNSLGTDLHMWDDQVAPFTRHFRLVRYDRRGHGQSDVPKGPYSMERLGRDVLAVLDALAIPKINWCGLSMGGMVGQWLGANAPTRMGKIILANTTCHFPDPTNWHNRIKAVSEGGLAAIADTVIAGWLTADFRERAPQAAENLKAMLLATPVKGYLACCEALSTLDQRELLPNIKSPTLVIAGRHDMGTTVAAGEFMRSRIPGASMTILDAAHISNVEQSHAFTDAIVGFLTQR